MKLLNTNKEHIQARKQCARCGYVFEQNDFKVKLMDSNEYVCEECEDKVRE